MGTQAWFYVVPHGKDLAQVLRDLRDREFRAGRYFPASITLSFSFEEPSGGPGAQHATIQAARNAAAEEGTKSILDVEQIAAHPRWGSAAPIDLDVIEHCLGPAKPSLETLRLGLTCLLGCIDRGDARFLVLYSEGQPSAVAFYGLSFD